MRYVSVHPGAPKNETLGGDALLFVILSRCQTLGTLAMAERINMSFLEHFNNSAHQQRCRVEDLRNQNMPPPLKASSRSTNDSPTVGSVCSNTSRAWIGSNRVGGQSRRRVPAEFFGGTWNMTAGSSADQPQNRLLRSWAGLRTWGRPGCAGCAGCAAMQAEAADFFDFNPLPSLYHELFRAQKYIQLLS